MGSKHASVHLRCDDSAEVLARLKKEFRKKKGPSKKDLMALEIINAFAMHNIRSISDPAEKAEKERGVAQIMEQARKEMESGDPATIVVRKHFVSIYWYDRIRVENLGQEMQEYAYMCGVPAIGVGVYDDTNFSICAVSHAGEPDVRRCRGEYMFDHDDIAPVKAEEICDIADAPFFLDGLKKALSADDGEVMAATFEEETGLPILMDDETCRQTGMKELYRWGGATVFFEGPDDR